MSKVGGVAGLRVGSLQGRGVVVCWVEDAGVLVSMLCVDELRLALTVDLFETCWGRVGCDMIWGCIILFLFLNSGRKVWKDSVWGL